MHTLAIIGNKYLKEILGSIIHKIVIEEHKISLEIDPSKCDEEEAERNKVRYSSIQSYPMIDSLIGQSETYCGHNH